MRLIEITAIASQAGPVDSLRGVNLPQHLLEALDSAEHFRSQANLASEELDEMLVAHSQVVRDVANILQVGGSRKLLQRPLESRAWPPFWRRGGELFDEELLQQMELGGSALGFEQLIAPFGCGS